MSDGIITTFQTYREMAPEKRPQDPTMDGAGWTFKTCEHGGAEPDTMPQAIIATDVEGRSCAYVPVTDSSGNVVDSICFGLLRRAIPDAMFESEGTQP